MSLRDRIDRLGHVLEAVDESVQAVRTEHDATVRERQLRAIENAIVVARDEHAALVEDERRRPKLRLLGVLIPAGLAAYISRVLGPLRRRRTAVVAATATVGITTAALAVGAIVLDRPVPDGGPITGAAPATSAPAEPSEPPSSGESLATPDDEEDFREQLGVESPSPSVSVLGSGAEPADASADPAPEASRGGPAGSASVPAGGASGGGGEPQPDPAPSNTDDQGGTGGQPSGTPTSPPGETSPPDDEPDHDGLICIELGLLGLDVCLL